MDKSKKRSKVKKKPEFGVRLVRRYSLSWRQRVIKEEINKEDLDTDRRTGQKE